MITRGFAVLGRAVVQNRAPQSCMPTVLLRYPTADTHRARPADQKGHTGELPRA